MAVHVNSRYGPGGSLVSMALAGTGAYGRGGNAYSTVMVRSWCVCGTFMARLEFVVHV